MTDPKKQQKAEEEQIAEDLTVPEEEAEAVRGGDGISLSYSKIQVEYTPQKPDGTSQLK
jgi:type VI protein secretion system component Hcp